MALVSMAVAIALGATSIAGITVLACQEEVFGAPPSDADPLHMARVGLPYCLMDGAYRILLAWILHLPPSAVPLVSDVRFCRSAQRSAWLT